MGQKARLGNSVQVVLSLLGLLIPVLFWIIDYSSKALDVVIVSSTSLSPTSNLKVPGLELTLNGERLDQPYLSVIEVTNSGDRPILASEFDSPLKLNAGEGVQIIRAESASIEPNNLNPQFGINGDTLILQPLLLNSEDKIRVDVLTSGVKPIWKGDARIVGVYKINMTDLSVAKDSHWKTFLKGLLGVMLLIFYANLLVKGVEGMRQRDFSLTDPVSAIVCGTAALTLLEPVREMMEINRFQALLIFGSIVFVSYVVFKRGLISDRGVF